MAFYALTGLVEQCFEPEKWELTNEGKLIEREGIEEGDLTKIQIKPLNGKEYYSVLQNQSEANKLACAVGVVGWDNLLDQSGKVVEFNKLKILEYLPPVIIAVIGAKVMEISSLDGQKVKN